MPYLKKLSSYQSLLNVLPIQIHNQSNLQKIGLNTKIDKLNLQISDTKKNPPVTNQIYQNWTQIEQAHTSKYGSRSIQPNLNKPKPISIQLGSSLPKEKKSFSSISI